MRKRMILLFAVFCILLTQLVPVCVQAEDPGAEPHLFTKYTDLKTVGADLIDEELIKKYIVPYDYTPFYLQPAPGVILTVTQDQDAGGYWNIRVRLEKDAYYVLGADTVSSDAFYLYASDGSDSVSGKLTNDCIFQTNTEYYELSFDLFETQAVTLHKVKSFTALGDYETTNVYDDLIRCGLDLSRYSFGTGDTSFINVITVNEAYYNSADQSDYGLFFYVYNPSGFDIRNATINLAVAWDSDGNPTAYREYYLVKLSDVSGRGKMDNCFVKFKVRGHADGNIETVVKASERVYQFNKITVNYSGGGGSKTYDISNTFRFTGQEYVSARSSSTKKMTCGDEEQTVYIEIDYTYYRTDTSPQGAYYHNQVDSIYFNVPNYLMEQYGDLTNVKLQYQKCRTHPMIVTDNQRLYQALFPYLFENVDHIDGVPELSIVDSSNTTTINYGFTYNIDEQEFSGGLLPIGQISAKDVENLKYLFRVEDVGAGVRASKSTVAGDTLSKWLYQYGSSEAGYKDIVYIEGANGWVGATFFSDCDEVTVIDTETLDLSASGFASSHNFFEEWAAYGFFYALGNEKAEDLDLTEKLVAIKKESQITGRSDDLYYAAADESDLRSCFQKSKLNDSTMYLCRFNVSQYYQRMLDVDMDGTTYTAAHNPMAYVAEQDVYMNLHLLTLDFTSEQTGIVTIVPVESNHIDCVADVTVEKEPEQIEQEAKDEFWKAIDNNPLTAFFRLLGLILGVVGIAVLFYFLAPILAPFFSAVGSSLNKASRSISRFFKQAKARISGNKPKKRGKKR